MNKKIVSVIITTYNREKFIKKAIDSVLAQSYKNFELIIVDDDSSDNTLEIISQYHDPRIKIIKNKINLGVVKSSNKAISYARGEYIARIDDDDSWCDKDKLKKQVEFLENNPRYVLVGCGLIKINKQGKEIKRYLLPEKDNDIRKIMLLFDPFVHSGVVFKKESCELVGGYNEEFFFSQDWDLLARIGRIGKMYNFPEYFVYLLRSDQNRTNERLAYHLLLNQKIRKKYRKDYPYFWIYYLLGWGAYLVKPNFLKIKQFYEKFKDKKY